MEAVHAQPAQAAPRARSGQMGREARYWDNLWTQGHDGKGVRIWTSYHPYFSGFVKRADLSGRSVADVGCGDLSIAISRGERMTIGRFVESAAAKYTGFDHSLVALENSARVCPMGTFIQSSATFLDAKNAQFDLAVSFNTLSFTADEYRDAIVEMVRVSKKGVIFNISHRDWIEFKGGTDQVITHDEVVATNHDGIRLVGVDEQSLGHFLAELGLPVQTIKVESTHDYNLMERRLGEVERWQEHELLEGLDVKRRILVKAFRE